MLLEMAKTADVFLQNARPGAADRNGFGYEALSAVNEELIYVSISGWGQTGPYARRPAYDAVMQTQTGFPVMQGGDDAPVMVNNFVCDKITSYQTAIAVLAALEAKSTGKCVGGQHIEISMLDSALSFFWSDAMGNTGAAYAGAEEGSVWNDEVGQSKSVSAATDCAVTAAVMSDGRPLLRTGPAGGAEDPADRRRLCGHDDLALRAPLGHGHQGLRDH